tara:strand:- start:3741 stop:4007 length:267 start_codon:yes stop_codon:yes gene_type:complete
MMNQDDKDTDDIRVKYDEMPGGSVFDKVDQLISGKNNPSGNCTSLSPEEEKKFRKKFDELNGRNLVDTQGVSPKNADVTELPKGLISL